MGLPAHRNGRTQYNGRIYFQAAWKAFCNAVFHSKEIITPLLSQWLIMTVSFFWALLYLFSGSLKQRSTSVSEVIVVKLQKNKRRRAADSINNTARRANALLFWSLATISLTKLALFYTIHRFSFEMSENWPSGRRHSPAKGAYELKLVSRVRIPHSPPSVMFK